MQAIMQGHGCGFTAFQTWYRKRDSRLRAEAANRETVARIFSAGLSQSLNFVLPGSGVFLSALRGGLSGAYSEALSEVASFEGGDPDLFLARQEEAIEAVRSNFLARADSISDELDQAFEDLKWEYVLEYQEDPTATDTDPSPHIRDIAAHYGVPRPNKSTIDRVALSVLESHIKGVLAQDRDFQQGYAVSSFPDSEAYTTAAVRVQAYRHFYAGEPDRYCPVEIELYELALFGLGSECQEWRRQQR